MTTAPRDNQVNIRATSDLVDAIHNARAYFAPRILSRQEVSHTIMWLGLESWAKMTGMELDDRQLIEIRQVKADLMSDSLAKKNVRASR